MFNSISLEHRKMITSCEGWYPDIEEFEHDIPYSDESETITNEVWTFAPVASLNEMLKISHNSY